MLLPSEIDNITEYINKYFVALEDDLVNEITDRLASFDEMNIVALNDYNVLNQMGLLNNQINKKLAVATDKTTSEISSIVTKSMITSFKRDNIIFSQELSKDKLKISESLMQTLRADVNRINYDIRNLTGTTASTTQTEFYNALNLAHLEVVSGSKSYTQAMIDAIDKVAESGVDVLYPSGHKDKLEVATRRAIVTSVNQTNGSLQLQRCRELEWGLVEVSAHIGARPTHAEWQGKVFSLNGNRGKYKDFYKETGYGTLLGLCGVNCGHTFFPYYEGSSTAYDLKELEEINNKKVNYKGKDITYYEATQYQRSLERNIRKCSRQIRGNEKLLTNSDVDVDSVKYSITRIQEKEKALKKELKDFSDTVGLKSNNRLYGVGTEVKLLKKPNIKNTLYTDVKKDAIIKEEAKVINSEIIRRLRFYNIEERPVERLSKKLTEEAIIERLGGGDLTEGSCSSLAFAYIGNKNGLDVLDYRGGRSLDLFSKPSIVESISKIEGAKTLYEETYNEIKGSLNMLSQLKENTEYYFCTGAHATIVKRIGDKYQYLELQTNYHNGFHNLTAYELKRRFGCTQSRTRYGMKLKSRVIAIEVDSMKDNEEFRQILAFLNTEKSKQIKGLGGYAK